VALRWQARLEPGESLTQNITVVVNSDTVVEPDEAFQVLLDTHFAKFDNLGRMLSKLQRANPAGLTFPQSLALVPLRHPKY
jgi:hypothetical protein